MRPAVGATTERLYDRLPEFYRDDDEADGDYPLLRYISLIGDQASEIEDLVNRLGTDLADPRRADPAWVQWLAQLVGYDATFDNEEHRFGLTWLYVEGLGTWNAYSTWNDFEYVVLPTAGASLAELRDAIANASVGWHAGTRGAIITAVQSVLEGSRSVRIFTHSNDSGSRYTGTEWDVLIVTADHETPSPGAVLEAVTRKKAKPAGVVLWHRVYEATWTLLETDYPTWTAFSVTWETIEETGV